VNEDFAILDSVRDMKPVERDPTEEPLSALLAEDIEY
jgi:hypothetical protein